MWIYPAGYGVAQAGVNPVTAQPETGAAKNDYARHYSRG